VKSLSFLFKFDILMNFLSVSSYFQCESCLPMSLDQDGNVIRPETQTFEVYKAEWF
jgi:hypothetical protein